MPIKPGGRPWTVKEQIIKDPVSGLSFQFETVEDGTSRLRVYGDLSLGNREFVFDRDGEEAGSGTALTGLCRATWIK